MRAFDASGGTERLIVRMSGSREMGFRLPFRINKFDEMHRRRVTVSGPGGRPATAEIPEVTVKDCTVAEQVTIDVRLHDRSPHFFTLNASVTSAAGAVQKFEPVSYEWDFGDGSSAKTDVATVEHSYEGKPEKTRFSYFLMRVKIKDRHGRELSGSRAYGFPNFGFGTFVDDRRILVHTAGGSAPGERAAEEKLRLYHGFEGVVHLERVRSSEVVSSERRELSSEEHSADALLGVNELAPGKSTPTRDLSALRPTAPGRVRKLEFVGRSGPYEARGTIVLTSTAEDPRAAPAAKTVDETLEPATQPG